MIFISPWHFEHLNMKYDNFTAMTTDGFLDCALRSFKNGQATERFEDAPIRVIEYADFLCPDCLFMHEQLNRMVIGTLPYAQLWAIFQSLLAEGEKAGDKRFLENWVEFQPKKKK
jgi:hypothetical protein